jgi:hypothetical protein
MPRKSLSRRRSHPRKRLSQKRGGSVTAILAGLGSFALGTSAGAGGMYLYKSRGQRSLPPSFEDYEGPPPPPPPYDDDDAPRAPPYAANYGVTPEVLQEAMTKLKKSRTDAQVERTIQDLLNEAGMSTEAIGKKEACAMVNEAKANKKLNIQEANRLCDALYQCYDNNGRCDENGSLTRMGIIQPGQFGGRRRTRSRRNRTRSRSRSRRTRSTRTRRRRTQNKH